MVCDAADDVAQVGLWVEAVQLGGADQAVDRSRVLAAGVGSGKQPVLPAKCYRPHGPLDRVVVDGDGAVLDVAQQCRPSGQGIADGGCDIAAAGQPAARGLEPDLEVVQQRQGLGLADQPPLVRGLAVDPLLDRVELADPLERLAGQRRGAAGGVDVVELAPDVRPARSLRDAAALIQAAKPGIAVGLQHAAEPSQMRPRMLARTVRRVAVAHCRRRRAGIGPLVAQVCPEPAGGGLAGAGRQQRDRRVSACRRSAVRMWRSSAATSGRISADTWPTQSASVERSSSTP